MKATFCSISCIGFRYDDVVQIMNNRAGQPNIEQILIETHEVREGFEEARSMVLSNLSRVAETRPNDRFIQDLVKHVEQQKILYEHNFIALWRPTETLMSQDRIAVEKGLQTPPHISMLAHIDAIQQSFIACSELAKIAHRAGSHLRNLARIIHESRTRPWDSLHDVL
jgi:hypothetical protein